METQSVYGNDLNAELKEVIMYFKCLKCGKEIARYASWCKITGKRPRWEISISPREILNKYCIACLEAEPKVNTK